MATNLFRRSKSSSICVATFIQSRLGSIAAVDVVDDFWEASTLVQYTLTAQGGSYSFDGNSATLLKSKVLVAQGGTYNYSGQDVVITFSAGATVYTLTAQGGSYNLTGSSTTILKSKLLTASGGTYSTTGQSASIYKSKLITASGGVYNYTGSNAVITYATVGGAVWPLESQVLLGITYGPTGSEYVGTLDVLGIKYDIATGNLVKPINSKVVMTL